MLPDHFCGFTFAFCLDVLQRHQKSQMEETFQDFDHVHFGLFDLA